MERIPVSVMTVMSDKCIEPFRVEYEDKDGLHKIRVARILQRDKKSTMPYMDHPRSTEYTFKCEAVLEGTSIPFTLTFNADNCRWWMYMK